MVLPPAIIIRRPAALGLPEVARIIIAFVSHVLAHIQGDLHCLSFAVPPIPFPVKQNCISSGCTSQCWIRQNVGKDISASAVGTNEGAPFSGHIVTILPDSLGQVQVQESQDGIAAHNTRMARMRTTGNTKGCKFKKTPTALQTLKMCGKKTIKLKPLTLRNGRHKHQADRYLQMQSCA